MAATSPNLGLRVWNLPTDPYDSQQLAQNWAKVDQHVHVEGNNQIPTAGLQDGSVTLSKLAANVQATLAGSSSGTIPNGAVFLAAGQAASVTGYTFTVVNAAQYIIVAQSTGFVPSALFHGNTASIQFNLDGGSIGTSSTIVASAGLFAPGTEALFPFFSYSGNLTAGAHTITVVTGAGATLSSDDRLSVLVFRG